MTKVNASSYISTQRQKDHSKFGFAKACSTQGSKCVPKFSSQYNLPANQWKQKFELIAATI